MSSTSVARAKFNTEKLDFKNIFQAEPPINSGYHFGSRLVIKNKHLYVTAGERGQGMIAQDHTKTSWKYYKNKFRWIDTKR